MAEIDELIVNVGSGTAVSKTIGSTKDMFVKQIEEIQKIKSQLVELAQQLEQQMIVCGREVSSYLGE